MVAVLRYHRGAAAWALADRGSACCAAGGADGGGGASGYTADVWPVPAGQGADHCQAQDQRQELVCMSDGQLGAWSRAHACAPVRGGAFCTQLLLSCVRQQQSQQCGMACSMLMRLHYSVSSLMGRLSLAGRFAMADDAACMLHVFDSERPAGRWM